MIETKNGIYLPAEMQIAVKSFWIGMHHKRKNCRYIKHSQCGIVGQKTTKIDSPS